MKEKRKSEFPDGVVFKPDGIHEADPCIYKEIERYENVTIIINWCTKCGHIDIS